MSGPPIEFRAHTTAQVGDMVVLGNTVFVLAEGPGCVYPPNDRAAPITRESLTADGIPETHPNEFSVKLGENTVWIVFVWDTAEVRVSNYGNYYEDAGTIRLSHITTRGQLLALVRLLSPSKE